MKPSLIPALATLALVVSWPGPAVARPGEGAMLSGEFVAMCRSLAASRSSTIISPAASACVAYTIGFLESAGFLTYLEKTRPRYCLPVGVTPVEVVKLALKYADSNSKQLDQPAAFLLRYTLETRFPCPVASR